jgi:hypothetical protein
MLQYLDTALVRGENQIAALERSKTVEGVPRYNEQDTSILEGEYKEACLEVANLLDGADGERLYNIIHELFNEANLNPSLSEAECGALICLVRLAEIYNLTADEQRNFTNHVTQVQNFLSGEWSNNIISIDSLLERYYSAIKKVFEITISDTNTSETRWREGSTVGTTPYDNRSTLIFENLTGVVGITHAAHALRNYHLGAKQMAEWLVAQFGASHGLTQKYAAFRLIFSPIVVKRIHQPVSIPSKGFTHDHQIDDHFDESQNLIKTMPYELFAHELGHVFINSAGYGLVDDSPLKAQNGTPSGSPQVCTDLACTADILLDSTPNAFRGIPYAGIEGTDLLGKRETVTNFIQNAAFAKLPIPTYWNALLQQALVTNALRSTPPAEVAAKMGVTPVVGSTHSSGSVAIFTSDTALESIEATIAANKPIYAFGRNVNQNRVFVGVEKETGLYNYGWVLVANTVDIAIGNLSIKTGNFTLINGELRYL